MIVRNFLIVSVSVLIVETIKTDQQKTVPQIISSYGYVSESHTIRTTDGYLLTLHRIPYSRLNNQIGKRRPVIFYMHGVSDSSASFVIFGPTKSPAFLMSDLGYDVWMGNMRGTEYTAHITMSKLDPYFWKFGIEELATIDVPNSIDYILKTTKEQSLTYIGFSLGTFLYFAMLGERPEYNTKINAMVALAPCAFYGNVTSLPWEIISKAVYSTGLYKILPERLGPAARILFRTMCSVQSSNLKKLMLAILGEESSGNICRNLQYFIFRSIQFDEKSFMAAISHIPQDTSRKVLVNLLQMHAIGKVQKYDYGAKKNLLMYNQTTPAQYNLTNVRTPLYFIHGTTDLVADAKDIEKLIENLPEENKPIIYEIPDVSHIDYVVGKKASFRIVSYVRDVVKKHTPKDCSKCIVQSCKRP